MTAIEPTFVLIDHDERKIIPGELQLWAYLDHLIGHNLWLWRFTK